MTDRCTWAACGEPATTETPQGWSFCAKHAREDAKMKDEGDVAALRPAGAPVKGLPVPFDAAGKGSPIALLLEDASAHGAARVRRLGERIEADLDRLRELIAEHAEAERQRRAEDARHAAARAEVARLEEQLKQARAKLTRPKNRGGVSPAGGSSRSAAWTPERRAAQAELARARNLAKAAAKRAAADTAAADEPLTSTA